MHSATLARACLDAGAAERSHRLTLSIARTAAEVEDAQRLRYEVFAEELGARIDSPRAGLDADEFDRWCDHLIVRDARTSQAVATYRILPPERARACGRRYSEREFDLTPLRDILPLAVEVGRSCVHRNYRGSAALMLLWAGLARYMRAGGYRHLIGCASVPLAAGTAQAAAVRDALQKHLVAPALRVQPRQPFAHARCGRATAAAIPPLIEGYLRLGARVCGEPAWDPDFNTADFLLWLAVQDVPPRYLRHFDLLVTRAAA
ncbi:MAG: GNAT family N-acyltransferase [Sutterellaceae bacterium]|nr:GNAT family N-acetyltransferase [Burkholderiaceae bacterium]MCX7901208.1 GNAT family N-acetyltransferase [Burkholderiaceae bacterium]MDW8430686.1 GNAT family N-acyltransferase [Sutterellaceae bacterium]